MKNKTNKEIIEDLERRIKELEKEIYPSDRGIGAGGIGGTRLMFDPECLHNGCGHDKNPACWLVCPHCSPMFH